MNRELIKRNIYLTAISCAAAACWLLASPSASMADDFLFTPRISSTAGTLELNMTSQTDENTRHGEKTRSTGTFFRERINLAADGYVYHPRFQIFLTQLSGSLHEANVSGNVAEIPRLTTASVDYELRTIFLPEHPYNLELYKLHHEASAPGRFLRGQTGALDAQGAMFGYKKMPYYFHTGYSEQTIDSARNRTSTRSYRANAGYHGRMISNTAAYTHGDSGSEIGVHTTREAYSFGNGIRLFGASLDSRVNEATSDHASPLNPNLFTRVFAWTEQLYAPLPLGFSSTDSFGYTDEINRTGDGFSGPGNQEDFNRSNYSTLNLSHRLYQSLVTNYTLNNLHTSSSFGEIESRSDTFGSTYSKKIPSGRLIAGIQYANSEAERRGRPAIINETHGSALFGTFTLNQQNIIEDSIRIQALDPATESLVLLPQGDYLVTLLGTSVRITIISVSPLEIQSDPAYVYEFRVSYSLADESKIASASNGFSVRLNLLENLLNPYYSYSASHQEVLSGSITGGPDRSTAETAGITTIVGQYEGLIEHQRFSSRLNPSETWTTTAQYQTPISENSRVSTLLSYVKTTYFPAEATPGSVEFQEKNMGVGVSMASNFPEKKLSYFAAGSFSWNEAVIDSNAFSLTYGLTRGIGLLHINVSARLSRTEAMYATGDVISFSQYYAVTLTRRLF